MTETTRAYLYRIITAAAPLAIAYGLVERDTVGLWIGLAGAILSVGGTALAAANTHTASARHRADTTTKGEK